MEKIKLLSVLILFAVSASLFSQKQYQVKSPDGKLDVTITVSSNITYTLKHENDVLIASSPISMTIDNGKSFGINSKVTKKRSRSVDTSVDAHFYKRSEIRDCFNEVVLDFKENFSLIFRAYDEGMAYRFVSSGNKDFAVKGEEAVFNFNDDNKAYVAFVRGSSEVLEKQFFNTFENIYTHTSLSAMNPKKIAFLPLLVEMKNGKKICITESDLENYPGMYLWNTDSSASLKAVFAPYPKKVEQGGYINLQEVVLEREDYIAKSEASTAFPWRIVAVSANDKELLDNDMVYKLAAPSRIQDVSWIKPGKVAWEWWNNWGLSHVDFKTGVNNETYMAYIDFASKHGIEYVLLDDGWSVNQSSDLFQVVPEIDIPKLVNYAKSKKVDILLWAGYYAFAKDMEKVCEHYASMGVKGFKIDFMDRDDQPMVDFHYQAAAITAKYQLIIDYHGTHKPAGLNRTYPNVLNFEGVHGLEQMKFSTNIDIDQVTYDVTMPFIRMISGPVDYTQGAMRNSNKSNFRTIGAEPMSQGTRCRQLAEYVVFESPLNMLCDSPALYEKESECTQFIVGVPTVWDKTTALNGEVAKYVAIARKKGNEWYLGALTNWDARTIELDLSFLENGNWTAEIFSDGINANKIASDYKREIVRVPTDRKISVSMASGGGCAIKFYKQ